MEYKTGTAEWVDITPAGTDNGLARIDRIYFEVRGSDWSAALVSGAYANIDYMTLTTGEILPSPVELYSTWLADFPTLGSQTNLTDNPDGDLYNNLVEYYFGGNPTLGEFISSAWVFNGLVNDSGTNYIIYVYRRRQDQDERGLSSWIELNTSMTNSAWTNDTTLYEFMGVGNIDGTWQAVTNRINAEADARFIRNRVQFSP